jgi:hypothetical protein
MKAVIIKLHRERAEGRALAAMIRNLFPECDVHMVSDGMESTPISDEHGVHAEENDGDYTSCR